MKCPSSLRDTFTEVNYKFTDNNTIVLNRKEQLICTIVTAIDYHFYGTLNGIELEGHFTAIG